MPSDQTKSVRFQALVKQAGVPEIYTPWGEPREDSTFQKAIKEGRVVTVHQTNVGSRKDFGVIGFTAEKRASFLVFPKPLEASAGSRVIGLNYDRIKSAPVRDPVKVTGAPRKRTPEPVSGNRVEPPSSETPKLQTFIAHVTVTAEVVKKFTVEAANRKAAEAEALRAVRVTAEDLRGAKVIKQRVELAPAGKS